MLESSLRNCFFWHFFFRAERKIFRLSFLFVDFFFVDVTRNSKPLRVLQMLWKQCNGARCVVPLYMEMDLPQRKHNYMSKKPASRVNFYSNKMAPKPWAKSLSKLKMWWNNRVWPVFIYFSSQFSMFSAARKLVAKYLCIVHLERDANGN